MKRASEMLSITHSSNTGFKKVMERIESECEKVANDGRRNTQVSGINEAIANRVVEELTLYGYKASVGNGGTLVLIEW